MTSLPLKLLLGGVLLGLGVPWIVAAAPECSWQGTGSPDPRGVSTVYLHCTRGTVKWRYPQGAVRVVLRTPGHQDFRGCVKVFNASGARLHLEGHRRLLPLYPDPRDQRQASSVLRPRCFTSYQGQVALYLEAEPPALTSSGGVLKPLLLDFSYDLQPVGHLQEIIDECRPCSDQEMVAIYCMSDKNIQGRVSHLVHDELSDASLLTVVSTKQQGPNSLSPGLEVTLKRDLKCQTKRGTGEFLFMTREILGDLVVVCAPRLSHWKHVRRKAILEKTHECRLD